jgi:hypothetical protein
MLRCAQHDNPYRTYDLLYLGEILLCVDAQASLGVAEGQQHCMKLSKRIRNERAC